MTIILAVFALLQGIFTLVDGIRSARHMRTFRPRGRNGKKVAVFCPCKGIDHEFEKNIQSIVDQDLPNVEVVFIVESEDDEAYRKLRELGQRVLVAGQANAQGQKVHNLTVGVRHAPAADIYVFCDSDARYPSDWLSHLLAPLDETNVTTGYRWYVARPARFSTLLRSAWNASSVSVLGDHNRNFVWGGSTAMHRQTFERLNVLEAWRGSISDDYSVMRAARSSGTKIVFVPQCLIPSYGDCTLGEVVEFTTRQVVITRVYNRRLWRVAFFGHAMFNVAFLILPFYHPFFWLAIYGLSMGKSWIRYRAVQTVLSGPALSKHGWFYILCSPVVAALYLYNMASSAMKTEIVWRNIRYKLVSPHETRILR